MPVKLFAQAPTINYTSPHSYAVNTAITPLAPTGSGVALPTYNSSNVFSTFLTVPWALATDVADNVYVSNVLGGIFKIPSGGGAATTIGFGFTSPHGLAVDAAGNVYVADNLSNTISKIPAGGGAATIIGSGFSSPTGVAVDADGNVYVSDFGNNAVKEVLASNGSTITIGTGFNGPTGIAVDGVGNVYVADYGNNAIKEILSGGSITNTLFTGLGADNGIAVDPSGNIFYSSNILSSINEIPSGSSTSVTLASGVTVPHGIAVDGSGNVYFDNILLFIGEVKPAGGYFINPALPAGLSFNTITGQISGTPTAVSPATNYTVTAYNSHGSSTANVNITVTPPPPAITSISPSSGAIGTLVTVTGTNLDNPTAFTIGGVTAITVSGTSTQLVGMVMPGAVNGAAGVTTASGSVSSSGNFTVTPTPYPAMQQGAKLVGTSPVGKAGQGYCVSVSADGNTAIVGGLLDNSNTGAAWIYTRSGGTWTQQGAKLVGTGATGAAWQGISVAINADGNTAIVGGHGDNGDKGAVWIYTRNSGVWTQQGSKLVGTLAVGNAFQGYSVSISADGNTAIEGGDEDNSGKGAAWIFTRSAGVWSQQGAKLVGTGASSGAVNQGFRVAISADGNTTIVGGDGDNGKKGAVWIYTRSGGVWTQQGAKLVGGGDQGSAEQGYSVALSADGNTAISGGFLDNSNMGAAWVFTRSSGVWTQQGAKLVGTGSQGSTVNQGSAVSLSADGNTALVGADFDGLAHAGATWVYTRSGGNWIQRGAKLVGTGASSASQGVSVSLSANGNTAIIGGYTDFSDIGAAWAFIPSFATDATLSNLTVSQGTLSPSFTSGHTTYTDNVTTTISSITVTPTVNDPNATVTVNGTSVTTGNASTPIALSFGPNIITTVVTAQDGTTKGTYTITVNRAKSTDATLSTLTVSQGTLSPSFTSGNPTYTDNVATTISSITVTPTVTDATATIKVNGTTVTSGSASGPIALGFGPNTITAVVTAQDGTTKDTYTITVNRPKSTDATLSNLTVSQGSLSPSFTFGNPTYTDNVATTISSITVTPTVTDATATIIVNGTTVTSGSASGPITLGFGPNIITTVVTAQDGTTKDTYTITVNRPKSTDATLSNLTVSAGTLSPSFTPGNPTYTDNVVNTISTIKVTPTQTDANATIKVNGTAVASGTASGPIALNVGANDITTVITAQDGTTINTYTITVTRAPSAIATLSNLTVSQGTLSPLFTSGNPTYTDNVATSVSSVTVTPTETDATATITVNGAPVITGNASGPIALSFGPNTITTVVTAQDGTTKDTYTITVNRAKSADATLSNLTVSQGTLSPSFTSGHTAYTDNVATTISSITLTPTVNDPNATVTVNGTTVTSGTASGPIALGFGPNTITTVVTAQDGTTKDTYTITVNRAKSADATLSNLTVSQGTLSPSFTSVNPTYTDNVATSISSITVTPTVTDATASIKVNGTTVTSGTASGLIALGFGPNTITTVVTAQNGTTTNTYTITVNRAKSTDATLNNLTVSQGTLSPLFTSGNPTYTDNVATSVSSLTVTPTVTDATATIKVNGTAVTSGNASAPITLGFGPNTITTVVTAQDGTTKDTYTITVNRPKSTDATLSNLAVNQGTLSPSFTSGNPTYIDNVATTVSTIKVTPTVTDATATITINGSAVPTGSASGAIALGFGSNTITTVVTAQDGTTKDTYTITVNRPKSTDATLSNLAVNQGTLSPLFTSGNTTYIDNVANTIALIRVTPTVTDAGATIKVNGAAVTSGTPSGPIMLNVGANIITTVVTAQDGATTNTYTITVTRAPSAIATLSDLIVSSGTLSPLFTPGNTTYADNVLTTVSSITVTPIVTDATTTVTVNGAPVTTGNASTPIALSFGPNTITTVVTAQDGTTKKTYTTTVNRPKSAIATLNNLTVSQGTLSPLFTSGHNTYTDNVLTTVSSITVTPTVTDATATITVNGTTVITGSASGPIALSFGANTITTVVTAQDGTTNDTYTITVNRPKSADATLSNLTVSQGTLSPSFTTAVAGYTDNVAATVSSITVTPTVTDATATITVNGATVTTGNASAPIALIFGPNTITTVVTAQNGITKDTYTITVNRPKSTIATLNNLVVSQGTLSPSFTSGTATYTDNVATNVSSITVTPTVTDATATIMVKGITVATGTPSGPIALNFGANTITTVVTAQDGTTKGIYVITVNRPKSTIATLNNLTVSQGTLSPSFTPGNTTYIDNVATTVSTVTVTPTVTNVTATITVNGTPVTTGTASGPITLGFGPNTITTIVTAQDGTTKDTYTITVNRPKSTIATLNNLVVSAGTLSPSFTSGNNAYTDNVANTVTAISVTPTVTDANATIKINGTAVASGMPSGLITLNVGANEITTIVTAQDGTTTDTYTITVTRAPSAITTLSNLTVSQGTLSPVFVSTTTIYTDVVNNGITSVAVTPTETDASATIKVNGTTVISGAPSAPIALNVGANTITTIVTAQNGTTKAYTTTVTRLPSSNAGLTDLTISSGTLNPAFATGTVSYTDNVGNLVTSVTVTPTADPTAAIKVNGMVVSSGSASAPITLNLGANTIKTVITAQDGLTTKTYTIVVTRALSATATLANLAVSAGTLSPVFASTTTAYTDNVSNTTASIKVTPTITDPLATIKINGIIVSSGSASGAIALNVGPNNITTTVTAQDGTTTDTYTINVTRAKSSNAGLAGLTISAGTLSPVFATGTNSYTATVTNTTAAITVTPVTSDPTATVTVNGVGVVSGSASGTIPLNVGPNTITTIVTAQNGTTNTYTTIITRAPSSAATLANLTISSGTLTPGFASGTTAYTDNVSNAVTSVTVTPTTSDPTATITVNGKVVTSGSASGAIALNVGANTITTVITAQDGTTTDTYSVTVNRAASSNASLANLTVSSGVLNPLFAATTTNYADAVTNATASITVTPTVSQPNATITVNGAAVTSGTASPAIALSIGANTITTVVTAQDGLTKTTYTISVNRDKGTQTITFNALADVTYGSADITPIAAASSGLPVIYSTSDPGVATIVNGKVHLNGTGSVTITARVDDDADYYAATPVSQQLTVNKADQTISTMDIPVLLTGTTTDLGSFAASSGLPVTFTVSDTSIAVIRGNMLVAKQIGTVTLTVLQPGNNLFNAAESRYTVITVTDTKDDQLVAHPVVTPNGDGINDYFLVEGIKNYPDNMVTIANRNGVRIYTARGYDNETLRFEGHSNINGEFQPAGTYFYLIDYTANGEHKHKKGFIVLKY